MACILVVEDNADNLKLMSYLLRAFVHTVVPAGDGQEALDLVQAREADSFDLILCDIQLPKLDGYEVARQLRKDPALDRVPLVVVTAFAMVGDRDRALKAGFNGYLTKPVVPRTFVDQVTAFLGAETGIQPGVQQPTLTEPKAWRPADPAHPQPRPSRATILLVDDTWQNLKLNRNIIESSGYSVLEAMTVQEGMNLLHQSRPDLILSDVHMPKVSGFDFIEAVKRDPDLRPIPFVFLSSTVFELLDCDRGLELGAVKFLLRPITPQRLLDEIAECLGTRTS